MLKKLIIKNIALIDSAEINFTEGLNVLSGETGSGKSVIIDSLNFVLGAKADKALIRSGESECFVKAEFDVSNNRLIKSVFDEFDIDADDVLIISRKFNIDGKNSIKINGNASTVAMLKKFTSKLVDVHGQSEHFNLLKTSNQLDLVDKFCSTAIHSIKDELKKRYSEYKSVLHQIENGGGDESQRLIKLDILNFQINEIENSNIYETEEEELIEIKKKLQHQEKIMSALNNLRCAINNDGGICDILGNVSKLMNGISEFDKEYLALYDRIESIYSEVSDIADGASNCLDNVETVQYNEYEIEDRLKLIKSLKNKYGTTYQDIVSFLDNAKKEKEIIENFEENSKRLTKRKDELEKQLYGLYVQLRAERVNVSKLLEQNVLNELHELGMPKAQFSIAFNDAPTIEFCQFNSDNGFDNVEFMFSANNGEPLKSLSFVISGGEMSRFMLAIKAQTAKYNDVSTFIFDEIDAGISGNTAKVVAEKFAQISFSTQIIAITHLPQISAMADNNLLIEKNELIEKTLTTVRTLSANDKVFEIVRLIGGDKKDSTAVNHAENLISSATAYKKAINI